MQLFLVWSLGELERYSTQSDSTYSVNSTVGLLADLKYDSMEDNKRMSETSDAANIEINRHTFVDKPTKKYVTGRRAKSFSDQLSNQKKNLFKFAFRNNFLKRKKVKNKFTSRGQSYWEKFNSTLVIPQKSFELQALETLFTVIISLEVQEVQALKEDSEDILNLMKKSPLLGVQTEEKLRLLKDSLSSLSDRIISCVKMIEEITDDDEEMSLMNLTTLRQDPMLYRYQLEPV